MKRKIIITDFMLKFLIPHFSFLILFLSCQTIPDVPNVYLEDASHAPLDTGALVYLFADAKEARDIINILPIQELKDSQVRQMLDRTGFLAAALFPEKSGRRFQLTAWGNYPGGADVIFSADKNWEKHSDGKRGTYWHSSAGKLSLAVNPKNAFAGAWLNSSPSSPFAAMPGAEIPEGFNEFRKEKKNHSAGRDFPRAHLSCWMEDPGTALVRVLSDMGIPIRLPFQKIFIGLYNDHRAEKKYTARILLQFENASHARGTAAVINLAGGFIGNTHGFIRSLLFSNPLIQEGRNLEFVSAPLGEEDILNLFNMFSLF